MSKHTRGCPPNCEVCRRLLLEEAAPQLLEACKDLVERFVKAAVASGTDKEFAELAVAPIRALIAKVDGRS